MSENPLLPHAELRALHQLLLRADAHASEARRAGTSRAGGVPTPAVGTEALLAATLLQLRPGDVILPEEGDTAVPALVLPKARRAKPGEVPQVFALPDGSPRLLMAAGIAAGMKRAGDGGLVLALCRSANAGKGWDEALAWAQAEKLPLIVAVLDPSGADAFLHPEGSAPGELTWESLQRVAGRSQVPVLSVDGQDAVAMYRVVQESVLRARAQAGPAVLWSVLPTQRELQRPAKGHVSPLARLEDYLRVRQISLARPRRNSSR